MLGAERETAEGQATGPGPPSCVRLDPEASAAQQPLPTAGKGEEAVAVTLLGGRTLTSCSQVLRRRGEGQ